MDSEVPKWVFYTNLILDGFVIVTVPLYILFLKHLIKNKNENIHNSGFAFILFANGIWDIASSIVYLLINEFPQRGIFLTFYVNEPLWKGRISKAFQFGIQFFQLFSVIVVAVNRWFAVKRPIIYLRMFTSKKMTYIYGILYISTIIYMTPILLFAGATIYNEDGVYYYGFFQSGNFVLGYGMSYVGIALFTFIVWIFAYFQITLDITKHEKYEFQQNPHVRKERKSVAVMTVASFLFSFGTILQFIIQVSNDIAWRFFGVENFYPILTLFTLTRIGQEMANLSTPWILILLSHETRKGIKAILGFEEASTSETKVIQICEQKSVFRPALGNAFMTYNSTITPLQIQL